MNKYWNVGNLFLIGAVAVTVMGMIALMSKDKIKQTN